jgi:pilus assembly protein FimV
MLRKTVVILTMMLCSMATQLYALELGTVTVESAVNQPLRMRVELLQLGDTRLQDIRVSMASSADFERFNINPDDFLSSIRFSVESSAQDNAITLISSQIVREPSLSFILDTRWPNGRLLSEHTIFLELPVFDDQQSTYEVRQPVSRILQALTGAQAIDAQPFVDSSAASILTAPSSTSSATSLQPEAIEVADESVEPEFVELETIETSGGDTLSDIAQQVKPNTAVSMQQTMLALQELNPEAFADGNINRLFSGQVLRVPTLEEIQSIDPRDAVREVLRQNQELAEVDVQPLAATLNAMLDQGVQPQGQLSLVSSDDAIDTNNSAAGLADAGNETLDQRIAELERQLAQRSEGADRARIEREELDSRMADLETQIAAAQEIIRLQDIQLAQLQDSLAAAAVLLMAEQQVIANVSAAAEAALPVDSPSNLTDDVMRILTGSSVYILFGIVLVILLLVVLMLRKNRAAKADNNGLYEIAEQDFDADAQAASTEDSEKGEAAEDQDSDPADLDSEPGDILGVSGEAGGLEEVAEEQIAIEEAPQQNVIAIVEELISEQRYRDALSMLNTSLQEQGDNEDMRAKIFEVENLLEAEVVEQQENAEATKAVEAENSESETKPFLDDLGTDLDSFDSDYEINEPEVEETRDELVSAAVADETAVEFDNVEMMFDLGVDDDAGESNVEEFDAEVTKEIFEPDLDDHSNAVKSEAKDSKDFDIDALGFDADPVEEVIVDTTSGTDEEIETFAFDANVAPNVTKTAEVVIDDDLEFLSDNDGKIESVDEVEEIDMLSEDETTTKLELAYAYQKMGDIEGATEILLEVIKEGSDDLVREASELLSSLDGKSD